jgi:hypothetical protein
MVGPRWNLGGEKESTSLLLVLLKLMLTHGKGRTRDSHHIINEWGGAWAVLAR